MLLERIQKPNDIKDLSNDEILALSDEIREYMLDTLSHTGGHVASNLGVVELTIALHLCLDLPNDAICFDVGHQCYTHKLLTGRASSFDTLRQYEGISGFPDPGESDCDPFVAGHASGAISLGLGLCMARQMTGDDSRVVAVVGDGALTGGMAYEALNNASCLDRNLLIVLNDNNMSISENVGGMSAHLASLRTSEGYRGLKQGVINSLERLPGGDRIVESIHRTKSGIKQLVIPGMIFENMGIMYLGPVDGHDIFAMKAMFEKAFGYNGPVVVHVLTEKGKGYEPAKRHPARFHGTGAFDRETGLPVDPRVPTWTDVFSTVMRKLGERDEKLVAITAAMKDGTGLKRFANLFPERFFDVGIAEEHAVTFAAALAKGGLKPVVCIYSSFLQRAYDQLIHDVAISGAHVVFAVDRAGIVGSDGKTHQGIFDISFLTSIPGFTVMAPKNKWELSDMMKFALYSCEGPVAIRYPRGACFDGMKEKRSSIRLGRCEMLRESHGSDSSSKVLFFALGSMVRVADEVIGILGDDCDCDLCNARFAAPLDADFLRENASDYQVIVSMEEGIEAGGMGEKICMLLSEFGFEGKFLSVAIPDTFVRHGKPAELMKELEMDPDSIAERVRSVL